MGAYHSGDFHWGGPWGRRNASKKSLSFRLLMSSFDQRHDDELFSLSNNEYSNQSFPVNVLFDSINASALASPLPCPFLSPIRPRDANEIELDYPHTPNSSSSSSSSSPPIMLYSKETKYSAKLTRQCSTLNPPQVPPPVPFSFSFARKFIHNTWVSLRSLNEPKVKVQIIGDLSAEKIWPPSLQPNSLPRPEDENDGADLCVIVTSSDPMTPSCLNRIFNVAKGSKVLLVFTTSSNGLTLQHSYHPLFTNRSYCCSCSNPGWASSVLHRVVGTLGGSTWGTSCVESTIENWGDKSGIAGGLFVQREGGAEGHGFIPKRVPVQHQPVLPPQPPMALMRSPRTQGGKSPKRRVIEVEKEGKRSASPSSNMGTLSINGKGGGEGERGAKRRANNATLYYIAQ